jgi:ribosomal protein L40E
MKCSECGAENSEAIEFCNKCGMRIIQGKNDEPPRKMSRTDRLGTYLQDNPRSGPRIIFILSVVLMLALVTILAQALDLGQYFEPPYPSEETPLTLAENGIVWTAASDPHYVSTNYSLMRWHWSNQFSGFDRPLANLSNQQTLGSGTQASVDVVYARITDILGDGEFNIGDQILFNGQDAWNEFPVEGTIYRLALIYVGWNGEWEDDCFEGNFDIFYWGEYSCAVDDGKFYSWRSHELSSEFPWWYWDKWNSDPSPF